MPLVESMTKFALLELSRRRVQRVEVSPQGILFVLAAAVQYPDAKASLPAAPPAGGVADERDARAAAASAELTKCEHFTK